MFLLFGMLHDIALHIRHIDYIGVADRPLKNSL